MSEIRRKVEPNDLCRICGAKATGCHYGIITCGGCNFFFRRAIVRKIQFICQRSEDCKIDDISPKCKFCRLKKCYAMGMSRGIVGSRNKKYAAVSAALEKQSSEQSSSKPVHNQEYNEKIRDSFSLPVKRKPDQSTETFTGCCF